MMSKKSKDSRNNLPKNKVRKHNLEYFDNSNFETKDINEVTSLLLDTYKTYNGRRFLNDDNLNCLLPSDKIELERSTLSHLLMRHQWKGNFCSPIKEKLNTRGTTMLDIGCGPGLWAIDMGLKYPSSSIIAIDIDSSNFPPSDQYPQNVCFLTCNAINGIPFPQNTFDFVNISMMWSVFSEAQWILVIKELVRVLKHDGWIEFTEPDPMVKNRGKKLTWLMECFSKACQEIRDVNVHIHEKIPNYIKEMDELKDLTCMSVDYPLGGWYGCFGDYALKNFKRVFQGLVFLPKYMEMSNEEFNGLLNGCLEEANKYKAFFTIYKCFAKKASGEVSII